MMRITTLCSAFILSILSLSLFAQESVDPSPLPTDSLQPAPEAIKPAKTVKSSTVVAKARESGDYNVQIPHRNNR